ncbi:MAG: hypothetical protein HZC22_13265 [Rhodocyclales bacterium]|nr:hypothetical protein [Rhodocyclales bacterium]
MVTQHTPIMQYRQALQIAKDNNMFVVEKDGHYIVYRKNPIRNIYLGACSSAGALFKKVSSCASH